MGSDVTDGTVDGSGSEGPGVERRGQDAAGENDVSDDELLARYAAALADRVEAALPQWVASSVARRLTPDVTTPDDFEGKVAAAGRAAASEVGGRVRELLRLDIDEQWTNPLTLIRTAIRYPTGLLSELGVPPVDRDAEARRFHPDDVYDLTPASFAELGPDVHNDGISWGAAKAHVHLRRRRSEEVA